MKNFAAKHWRGQYSLIFSFWSVGILLGSILYVMVSIITNQSEKFTTSLTASAWIFVVTIVCFWFYQIWACIGIWRSASNYENTKKSFLLGKLAKACIILIAIHLLSISYVQYFPLIKVMSSFMLGNDPIGRVSFELLDQNTTLKISGVFGNGAFNTLKEELDNHPTVTRLYLASNGGRFKETSQIARLIQERRLDTYIEEQCLSFCTLVFLAGHRRYATPTARIGFHAPSIDGGEALVKDFNLIDGSSELYKSFNLPQKFINKIFATPNSEMWFPSYRELLALGIVSDLSLGGESNQASMQFGRTRAEVTKIISSIDLFQKYDARYPGFIAASVDKAMPLIDSGMSDSDILTAIRTIASPLEGKTIANSNQEIRLRFAELAKDEAIEISKYGPEACVEFLLKKLDLTKILPKEMVARELQLSIDALDQPPERPAFNNSKFENALGIAQEKMSKEEVEAIATPSLKSGEAACTGMVKFYTGIVNLSPHQRDLVIYGMFK